MLFFSFFFLMFTSAAFARQEAVSMADALRSSGKIYVVVTVLVILLVGFIVYLISIDRRLKKIEKSN